jgi:hypothetical protein
MPRSHDVDEFSAPTRRDHRHLPGGSLEVVAKAAGPAGRRVPGAGDRQGRFPTRQPRRRAPPLEAQATRGCSSGCSGGCSGGCSRRAQPGTTSTLPCWTANLLVRSAPRGIRTPNRQIRRLVLSVELVGSRRICPAHVGYLVDPVGSRRTPSDRLDDQRDDQATAPFGHWFLKGQVTTVGGEAPDSLSGTGLVDWPRGTQGEHKVSTGSLGQAAAYQQRQRPAAWASTLRT